MKPSCASVTGWRGVRSGEDHTMDTFIFPRSLHIRKHLSGESLIDQQTETSMSFAKSLAQSPRRLLVKLFFHKDLLF